MRRPKDKLIAGLDLHSNNVMIGVINQDGKRVAHRKLDCDLDQVVGFLKPFKPQLQSMAVESTFNWYWLVDGLRAQGYSIDLANPAKIEQYSGMKHVDDKDDAFHLAEGSRPSYDMASKKGHHRGLMRTGHVLIGVARELGRAHRLPATHCRGEGYRLTKGSRRWLCVPRNQRARRGDTN